MYRDLSDCRFILSQSSIHDITCLRLQKNGISAVSKAESQELSEEDKSIMVSPRKGSKTTPRTPRRSRKKTPADNLEQSPMETVSNSVEESTTLVSSGDSKKTRKPRMKGIVPYYTFTVSFFLS